MFDNYFWFFLGCLRMLILHPHFV